MDNQNKHKMSHEDDDISNAAVSNSNNAPHSTLKQRKSSSASTEMPLTSNKCQINKARASKKSHIIHIDVLICAIYIFAALLFGITAPYLIWCLK